ncbi:3-oxoacyl-[acyl-carrier protein] reductase [Lentzea waywayandensis]|uniref:3-oxoacyl-[acyl-carrier protein] reductase n=1 Tax=Lentzea waywayandensis TaxID=84724 RepID=A0A1I6FIH7_9PSEU|nr:SDR family oxidoreductase [Lentzea waywayandensis]SFR29753.1 3-oxoacyl-[acyl-carrier protein] reductase [Lentzea waywayandensis]
MTRVAIVTGGSRGIGRAAAERLAADGTAVVIVYAGNKTAADEAVEKIRANGGQAVAAQADVGDEKAVTAAFELAVQTFGGVDVVVNSAGIMPLGTVADMDLDTFDRIMRTNARGTFIVNQQAARRLRDGGAIINVSSSVVGLRFPQYGAYAMSKGGVEALTLILARELRGRDITVNTVAPGPTATDLFLDGKDQATIDTLAKQPPLERLGSTGDIAEVISFLAGPARWINGQTIRANGGII